MSFEGITFQGAILAGGQGSRMGGVDKGLQLWHQKPLVTYALSVIRVLCDRVIISCNRNLDEYRCLGDDVVKDVCEGFEGPLSGLVSIFPHVTADWLLVSPCDTPGVTLEEFQLLASQSSVYIETKGESGPIYALKDVGKDHPLHCLIHRSAFSKISEAFDQGQRSVYRVFNQLGVVWLEVEDASRMANINSLVVSE